MKPGEIEIKDSNILEGLMSHRFDPKLTEIIVWVAKTHGLVMTESWRPARHKNDLHGQYVVRAVDIRAWCYPENVSIVIEAEINNHWAYDPYRPEKNVALLHDSGNGIHFHIQVHPNTVKR